MRDLARVLGRLALVLVPVIVAVLIHWRAVDLLPVDFDEDDYLRAGEEYAQAIRDADWSSFTELNYRPEHPPLAKIAYGVALSPLDPAPEIPDVPTSQPPPKELPQPHHDVARATAAVFGVLQVAALALLNPLAALLLAINTWQTKYTSQVMLEALPALTSTLCALAYLAAASTTGRRRTALLVLSAVFLGLTAASKYIYAVVGVAVVLHWVWQTRPETLRRLAAWPRWWAPVLGWGLLSVAVFFLANPYLWPDPVGRLTASIEYFIGYANTASEVNTAGFPLWMPFVWLSGSVPWHPGVFYVSFDLFISAFALVGLGRLWRRHRFMAIWLAVAMIVLLLWPTKWPQYTLILYVPLTIAAAEGIRSVVLEPLAGWWRRRRERRAMPIETEPVGARARRGLRDGLTATPWLLPGAVAVTVLAILPMLYQLAMTFTDASRISIKDALNGGVIREAVGGLTGQIEAVPHYWVLGGSGGGPEVNYTGLALYDFALSGSQFLAFGLVWTALVVTAQAVLGIAVALLLWRRGIPFRGFWLALFVLPWAIPEFVGATIWRLFTSPENGWLALGLGQPLGFMESPEGQLLALVIAATWMGWPLVMLAASAGLALIPRASQEAAMLDGAGSWQRFRYVTWPLLVPLVAPALIIRAIMAFNQFYLFQVMRSPGQTLAAISYRIFNPSTPGFGGSFSVAAAVNIVGLLVLVALIAWFVRWQQHAEQEAAYG
jgi:ABC-type sugar transport system permease subunit